MYRQYKKYLDTIKITDQYRKLTYIDESTKINYIDFTSNDYLNLSKHPSLLDAAIAASQNYGVGATGSRLLSGNSELVESFEKQIAQDKHTQSALTFISGFQANLTVLSTILDSKVLGQTPLVFFDRLNHSSLYQSIFLSGSKMLRYQHNSMNSLEDLLKEYQNSKQPKYIVTESIFGMDGDVLPIKELLYLAKKYQAFIYLDEAHATGILGDSGYGLSTTIDFSGIDHIIMGTFSKALGCSGAYIACSNIMQQFIINKSPGFIYSTANSPPVIAASYKSWEIVKTLYNERQNLLLLAKKLRFNLTKLGFDIGQSISHIIPIILKDEKRTIKAAEYLLKNKIMVSCVRPPTVPPNTSRLRIALNVGHKEQHIEILTNYLKNIL